MTEREDFHEAFDMASESDISPLHGYRGEGALAEPNLAASTRLPAGLTVALSREAGARGGSIARRVGARLGWDVYTQEMLDVLTQETSLRQEIMHELPEGAADWVEQRTEELLREQSISRHPQVLELAKVVLLLGARGEVVLLGRGAGLILPAMSTLHVRLVAPLADRVAYLGQLLRLTEEEATEQVRRQDHRRNEFFMTHFHRRPGDVHQYDLALNSSYLGEETCADLILQAAKSKFDSWLGKGD